MMMAERKVVFDRNMTNIVKGVGMLLMFCLHGYNQDYYDAPQPSWDYSFSNLGLGFQLCVGTFAFMIGYGYNFAKNKDLRYALSHITRLFIPYWVILFLLTVPFCLGEIRSDGIGRFLLNVIALDAHYNYFNWFIYLYAFCMATLPFVARLMKHRPVLVALVVCAVSYGLEVFLRIYLFYHIGEDAATICYNCLRYFPVIVLGLLFAHEGYFERINLKPLPSWLMAILAVVTLIVVLLLAGKMSLVKGFQLDFFYMPLEIGAIAVLFSLYRNNVVRRALVWVGQLSVYMWFFHALFYTEATRWFYQPVIRIFDNINLVVLCMIVVTFVASWLLKTVVDRLTLLLTKSHGG